MKKGKPELRKKGERREERMEGGGIERQVRKGERKWYNCVIFLITLVMPAVVVRRSMEATSTEGWNNIVF